MFDIHEANLRVGAQHEIAHALAYIAHGREFIDVELDDVGCGAVNVRPWAGRPDQIACIKMAGPAADFAFLAEHHGEDNALAYTVAGWAELLDLAHPDDDSDAIRSDQAGAASTGLLIYGFAWAAGFYAANRELISDLADTLRTADSRVTHQQVLALAGGRLRAADESEVVRVFTKLAPHRTTVDAIEAHVCELHNR